MPPAVDCVVYVTSFLVGEMELKIPTLQDRGEDAVRQRPLEGVLPTSSESEGG